MLPVIFLKHGSHHISYQSKDKVQMPWCGIQGFPRLALANNRFLERPWMFTELYLIQLVSLPVMFFTLPFWFLFLWRITHLSRLSTVIYSEKLHFTSRQSQSCSSHSFLLLFASITAFTFNSNEYVSRNVYPQNVGVWGRSCVSPPHPQSDTHSEQHTPCLC